jgi:hypothetical protein
VAQKKLMRMLMNGKKPNKQQELHQLYIDGTEWASGYEPEIDAKIQEAFESYDETRISHYVNGKKWVTVSQYAHRLSDEQKTIAFTGQATVDAIKDSILVLLTYGEQLNDTLLGADKNVAIEDIIWHALWIMHEQHKDGTNLNLKDKFAYIGALGTLQRTEESDWADNAVIGFSFALLDHRSQWLIAKEMLRLYSTEDPVLWHNMIAKNHAGEGDDHREARRGLAGRLRDEISDFSNHLDIFLTKNPEFSQQPNAEIDGMLWLDSLFFEFFETRFEAIKQGRQTARERWGDGCIKRIWSLWFDERQIGPFCHFSQIIAGVIWKNEIEPLLKTPKATLLSVTVRNDHYVKAHKTLSGISYGLDGHVRRIQVDNDDYTNAPAIARYMPRDLAILPKGKRPHQQTLGLSVLNDDVSLAVKAMNDTQALLGVYATKLTLYFLLTGHKLSHTTLGELVSELNPNRRTQLRDREGVAQSLRQIRGLGIVLPDNTDIQLFDIRAPINPNQTDPSQTISWGYSRNFHALIAELENKGYDQLRWMNGSFLMNYSAIMRFNGNEGLDMRHYITACSVFNDSMNSQGYDPDKAPIWSREAWAAQSNSLSQAAIDLLNEERRNNYTRKSKSEDLKRTETVLSKLEKQNLIRLEGDSDEFKILAPDAWIEAWEKHRNEGPRPKE